MKEVSKDLNKDLIIQLQQQQIQKLEALIKEQGQRIEMLLARIVELENNQKKNSGNSSKPPSTDIRKVVRTKSLRGKSGNKVGGQPGHKGITLDTSETPDRMVVYRVDVCMQCGKDLRRQAPEGYESRQVFDLPPLKLEITDHRIEIKSCSCCEVVNAGIFPSGVTQKVQYGTELQKLAVYFTNYQLLPYKRTSDLFEDLLGHRVSESTLVSMNQRLGESLEGFIEGLKQTLLEQYLLHADETGYYYNGNRNWLHVLTTERHTLYMAHGNRGREAMDAMGILPLYTGTLVHDFWKPYNEYGCAHSLCNIHHVPDLTFCEEIEGSVWAAEMKQLLLDVLGKVNEARENNKEALTSRQLSYWNNKYDKLITAGWKIHPPPKKQKGKRGATKMSKTQNLLRRFGEYKECVMAFARDFSIPFGNNLAEQAIRMMKVKQKISGCFRSEQGAQTFATIRSYISTMQKQGVTAMDALHQAFSGNPSLALG